MNITKVLAERKCTGCRACESLCPTTAISFQGDREGFLVPRIKQSKCIDCGKCYSKCPSTKDNSNAKSSVGVVAQYKDNKLIKKSASGGAFVGLANYFLTMEDTVVIGASLCEDLITRHIAITKKEDIRLLQNSKYVQSDIGDIYSITIDALEKGKTVLFTGCPCQVAGLYAVLPIKYEKLYTADIVCHGVPSPFFLKRSLEEASRTRKRKVVDYKFRHKKPFGKSQSSFYMMMMMKHGFPIVRKPEMDPYFNCFMKSMSFRESCYQCKYANLQRVADFTLGDCDSWGYYPNFHPKDSNSIILLNSKKAKKIWEYVQDDFDFVQLDVEREAIYNHQLAHPSVRPQERDEIYNFLLNCDWYEVEKKYSTTPSKLEKWKVLLSAYIPNWFIKIYGWVKK